MTTLIDGTPVPDNGDTGWGTVLNTAITTIDNRFAYLSSNTWAIKAAANGIVGATLSSNVTTSSLTSVGTLGSVTISGNASVGGVLTVTGNTNVTGNITLTGNLTVNGTTTTVNSTTVSVDDKNLELGSVATPSNTTADGGGITLKGATDKTLNWVNSTAAWTSSEDFNLATGKVYEINGTTVLSATQVLGKTVPTGTIVGTSDSQTLTTKTLTAPIMSAGTTSAAAMQLSTGTNLTTPTQGAIEFDGNTMFVTGDTTNGTGRGIVMAPQMGKLATGASVASGGHFFTATVRPALLAGRLYKFEYYIKFTKVTSGTVTFSFANSAATNLDLTGVIELMTAGTTLTTGTNGNITNINATTAATTTSAASFVISDATNMVARIIGTVIPVANTRLGLVASCSSGTVTSVLGSNFLYVDMGAATTIGNIG
jgi:hypothetical protein